MMRIVLADDHAVVRRGLREILAGAFNRAQFVEVSTGDEVLTAIRQRHCELLVLDINMPGRSGVEVLREVKQLCPDTYVLILSVQSEDQYALRCLRAGASGYLNKDSAEQDLVRAVHKVISGGRYVSEQLAEKLACGLQHPMQDPAELLSNRELEILRMIATGRSLTEIANTLHVSVKTVSTYRSRCLIKLQMRTNAELTRYALERNLVA